LDIIECPDRRVTRAAAEVVAQALVGGQTEVSVLLPRREYASFWHRFLHDRTADAIAETLSGFPHCNVTIVPYHLGAALHRPHRGAHLVQRVTRRAPVGDKGPKPTKAETEDLELPADCVPLAAVQYRSHVRVGGKVHALRVQPWGRVAALECTLKDTTGSIALVFLGRRYVPGIKAGARLVADGMVGQHRGQLAILNPAYEILPDPQAALAPPSPH
jgi:hypothetical protein